MTDATRRRGRRGDGTIYRTADGRLRAAVTLHDAITGEPVRRFLSARTDAEIGAKLKKARDGKGAAGRTPTVAAWSDRWLKLVRQRVRPATHRLYKAAMDRHIVPAIGKKELAKLLPSDVEAMTVAMIDGGSAPSTAALTRRVLVICLTDAARDGLILRNVAALARPPRVERAHRRTLTPSEVRAFVQASLEDPMGPMVALAVATGLRRGELLALRWSDVDRDRATLTVSRALSRSWEGGYAIGEPKSRRSGRTIALPALAAAALGRRAADQAQEREVAGDTWQDTTGLIFTDPLGRLWHPETVTTAYRTLMQRIGLAGLRLHDLRHTAATLALAAGVPVRDVADSLGHSSPSITLDIYGHSVTEGPRRVADAMDRALLDA